MTFALDVSSLAEFARGNESALEFSRRRLMTLQRVRAFSEEELAGLLIRDSKSKKLDELRETSDWSLARIEFEPPCKNLLDGVTSRHQVISIKPISSVASLGLRRSTKLKRMQNRNVILTFLDNCIFISKRALSAFYQRATAWTDSRRIG
jgi:hypothetical protein